MSDMPDYAHLPQPLAEMLRKSDTVLYRLKLDRAALELQIAKVAEEEKHEQAQRAAIDAVIAIIEPAALTKIEDKPRTRRNLREEALRVIRENNNSAHTDTIAKALDLKVRDVMPSLRYLADTKHITLGKDGICTMLLDGPVPARRAAPLPGLKPDMLGAE